MEWVILIIISLIWPQTLWLTAPLLAIGFIATIIKK